MTRLVIKICKTNLWTYKKIWFLFHIMKKIFKIESHTFWEFWQFMKSIFFITSRKKTVKLESSQEWVPRKNCNVHFDWSLVLARNCQCGWKQTFLDQNKAAKRGQLRKLNLQQKIAEIFFASCRYWTIQSLCLSNFHSKFNLQNVD